MSLNYFGYDGEPITFDEWARMRSSLGDEWRVGLTDTDSYHISTVWVGLDLAGGTYESMAWRKDAGGTEVACWRYMNRKSAIVGHSELVKKCEAGDFDGIRD